MFFIDVTKLLRDHDVGKVTQYTTQETLVIRLVKMILDSIPMSLDEYVQMVQTQFYLHPECSHLIKTFIDRFSLRDAHRPLRLSDQELQKVKKVLSSDYHPRRDVEEMAKILFNRVRETEDSNMLRNFNYLFAVDGLAGSINFKYYIDHLSIPWKDTCPIGPLRAHVDAVRSLYHIAHLGLTPDQLRQALIKVHRKVEIDTDNDPEKERSDIQLLYTKRVWFIEEDVRKKILEKKIQRLNITGDGKEERDCKYS